MKARDAGDGEREEEEKGMDHTLRIEDVLSPSHQRDGERARREAESPRAELPDWLAKELFKIFV